MLKALPLILFIILCHQSDGQVVINDSINQRIIHQLESRITENWQVLFSNDTIKLIYVNSNGIYARGCCPKKVEIPKEKKLLKWLKNDYVTAFYPTVMKISDTFKIEITFSPTWSKEKIDSLKNIQDSINQNFKANKVEICSNNFWNSNKSKQIIPYYSEKLYCSVFFDRLSAFEGIYKVEYEFGIPRFIKIDDEILMVEQITALLLGIKETCFTCRCEEN
jgi:hypothetical protein